MKGWIASDRDYRLHFFRSKPEFDEVTGEWTNGLIRYFIPRDFGYDLIWKDEPIEVELEIKKI